jgi:REP element-mobilizing transposase RayT
MLAEPYNRPAVPDHPFRKSIRLPPWAYEREGSTFHVAFRAIPGKTPFRHSVADAVWRATLNETRRDWIELVVACLMPDHVHFMVRPRSRTLVEWIDSYKGYTTHLHKKRTRLPFLWQPGFYDREIRNSREYQAVWSYIVRNPVSAGLVEEPEDWPYLFVAG